MSGENSGAADAATCGAFVLGGASAADGAPAAGGVTAADGVQALDGMSGTIGLSVRRVDRGLPLPEYAYPGDAGLDLRSTIDCCLAPGQRAMIATGLQLAIPDGFAGFVLPRSGMAARHGLSLVNTPGLIDSQYRGEIVLVAINLDSDAAVEIKRGDRLAQLVILPVPKVVLTEVDEFADTERSDKGFGSSGAS